MFGVLLLSYQRTNEFTGYLPDAPTPRLRDVKPTNIYILTLALVFVSPCPAFPLQPDPLVLQYVRLSPSDLDGTLTHVMRVTDTYPERRRPAHDAYATTAHRNRSANPGPRQCTFL